MPMNCVGLGRQAFGCDLLQQTHAPDHVNNALANIDWGSTVAQAGRDFHDGDAISEPAHPPRCCQSRKARAGDQDRLFTVARYEIILVLVVSSVASTYILSINIVRVY